MNYLVSEVCKKKLINLRLILNEHSKWLELFSGLKNNNNLI